VAAFMYCARMRCDFRINLDHKLLVHALVLFCWHHNTTINLFAAAAVTPTGESRSAHFCFLPLFDRINAARCDGLDAILAARASTLSFMQP